MKRLRGRVTGTEAGFSAVEMAVLLAVMLAFIAGVVLLTGRAVSLSGPDDIRSGLAEEADMVFSKLGALLGSAEAVVIPVPGVERPRAGAVLALSADLDGEDGPETVVVGRRGSDARLLVARVGAGAGGPRTATLTSMLDRSSRSPFTVEYLDARGRPVGTSEPTGESTVVRSVQFSLVLRSGDDSRPFERTFDLPEPSRTRRASTGDIPGL